MSKMFRLLLRVLLVATLSTAQEIQLGSTPVDSLYLSLLQDYPDLFDETTELPRPRKLFKAIKLEDLISDPVILKHIEEKYGPVSRQQSQYGINPVEVASTTATTTTVAPPLDLSSLTQAPSYGQHYQYLPPKTIFIRIPDEYITGQNTSPSLINFNQQPIVPIQESNAGLFVKLHDKNESDSATTSIPLPSSTEYHYTDADRPAQINLRLPQIPAPKYPANIEENPEAAEKYAENPYIGTKSNILPTTFRPKPLQKIVDSAYVTPTAKDCESNPYINNKIRIRIPTDIPTNLDLIKKNPYLVTKNITPTKEESSRTPALKGTISPTQKPAARVNNTSEKLMLDILKTNPFLLVKRNEASTKHTPNSEVLAAPELEEQSLLLSNRTGRRLDDQIFKEQAANAKYEFASDIVDNINGQEHQRQEVRNGLDVKGKYSYSDGFVRRTVHYEADDKGYRIVKEQTEALDGPVYNPNGEAKVSTIVAGNKVDYSVTQRDFIGRKLIEEFDKIQKEKEQEKYI